MQEKRSLSARAAHVRRLAALGFTGVLFVVAAIAMWKPGAQLGLPSMDGIQPVDELWVLISACLVFLMQAGFLAYEAGMARPVHAGLVAMLNVVDWAISSLAFFLIGFGIMFGSSNGLMGTNLFLLDGLTDMNTTVTGPTFFLFQLAFAGTAITLVSGALVERITLLAYSTLAVAIGLFIYPVYGHWVWGNALDPDNGAWLAELGFHDFAGGSVVHLLGATSAFVGIVMMGPRIGRFAADGSVKNWEAPNIGITALGTLILWFGWWGFNGGSHLAFTRGVAATIIVTNLAAVAGLVGAGLTAYLLQDRWAMNTKLMGGALGGLIAVTPGSDVVTPIGAVAMGLVAGWIYCVGHDLLLRLKIDDAFGVIPAHGFAAIWGLVTLPVFTPSSVWDRPVREQVLVQAIGVAVCILWTAVTTFAVLVLVRSFAGLRAAPMAELNGMDLEQGASFAWSKRLSAASASASASDDGRPGQPLVGSSWE